MESTISSFFSDRTEDPGLIGSVLECLQRNGDELTVETAGIKQPVDVRIKCFNRDREEVVLTVNEPGWPKLFQQKPTTVTILGRLLSLEVQADLAPCPNRSDSDLEWTFLLPQRVLFRQRRRHARIPVGEFSDLKIWLDLNHGITYIGRLHDISIGGISAELPDHLLAPEEGETPHYMIQLSAQQVLTGQLEVKHNVRLKSQEANLLGAEFVSTGGVSEQKLSMLVMDIERDWIKQRSGITLS